MAIIIQQDVSLKPYNTFGIAANARWFVEVETTDQLKEAIAWAENENIEPYFLGGGSNMLLTENLPWLVVKLSLKGISAQDVGNSKVQLTIAAGENWHQTVLHSLDLGLCGLENLSLIPGTVGAAPIQNIGAYGVELQQCFVKLEAFELASLHMHTFSKNDCRFGYRDSIFKQEAKGKYVITSVVLELSKSAEVNIGYGDIAKTLESWNISLPTSADVSRAVIHIRQSKLPNPDEIGNSGSFFKNPEIDEIHYKALKEQFADLPGYPQGNNKMKVPAGWLIEQAGWKGYRKGDAGVHAKQALVLVNYGNATGREILELSHSIQQSVEQKFGISLQAEVNIVP